MLPYQSDTVEFFIKILQRRTSNILEIGSDIPGEVASTLAKRTGVRVVGLNSDLNFPHLEKPVQGDNPIFIRGDGRSLPFPDDSFDAVLSIATLEHVNGIQSFLGEVARVLRPKGLFYTSFGPIWSSAKGHHVYAKSASKEARFWKPGRNPIPDYAHLLMTPEDMRKFLNEGPCCEELIDPIIEWIYYGDGINRCHFEEYIEAFQKSSMEIESLCFGNDRNPGAETLKKLRLKYDANHNFSCSAISVIFRKLPKNRTIDSFMFKCSICIRRKINKRLTQLLYIIKWIIKTFR
jgi:ubiquinone/menaquinone biosynthesis C-methylase UbiE